ncbi:NADPH-dependent ferric siderophore reductase [Serinibacter arcticus]|uniref:NADPH-dependent ferric siderophore reductase n=1 Tax=Serinibacter arcticus TaxID=1655435 RepID=A0A2U1ZUW6_9MICO|nr:siderophore-interacting protein [Serinibacter arcticus]PWD50759.1 NADPH-dependent ferric siderophore reductase [Serinibacter arcticus]
MARYSRLVKPANPQLLHLTVLRTQRLSPHWMRITLGGGEIEKFEPMGYDQWFRLFLPLGGEEGLDRLPAKANRMVGYLRYLRIPDGVRPVMRNYTVRAHRAATPSSGAEIDVDLVLHGTPEDGTAGPASRWAQTCLPGESVVIIDEGLAFNPEHGVDHVLLVADETGLPAVAGILASLPPSATGLAIVEAPSAEDVLESDLPRHDGVELRWIVRAPGAKPGTEALDALTALPEDAVDPARVHAWIAGEQALPTDARRHLVNERGVAKERVSFTGYWRVGASSPTPKSQVATA